MYCPKCGARNVEDAKYCRACGADISLVPQALTRSLTDGAALAEGKKRRKRKGDSKEPTLEGGLSKIFAGLGLLLIVLLGFFYFFGGIFFWIWFIIPALANFGEGLGILIRARRKGDALPPRNAYGAEDVLPAPAPPVGELAPRPTKEIAPPPPSVTEGTTRHLDATNAGSPGRGVTPQPN